MGDKQQPDERFSKILSDPRFRTIRKTDKTLKIDNRFKSMFTDDKFKLQYSMDKRGKSKKHLISEDYKKFYRLSDEKKADEISDDEDEENVDKEEKPADVRLTHEFGYHRGKIRDFDDADDSSSSSSSESEEDDDDDDDELDHEWGELDKEAEKMEEATSRIAICNADWDRINAQDLFVLFNSFKRATGAIRFVRIYYSKFGEERLKVEDTKGPSQFIFGEARSVEQLANESDKDSENDCNKEDDNVESPSENEHDHDEEEEEDTLAGKQKEVNDDEECNDDDDDDDDDVTDSVAIEKLRKYQLERLKYFYAVAEFDSKETAELIYNELDGMEYESSSTTLDIRFIPDDMNFEDVRLKEECSSMPNSSSYQAPAFINSALQQSKVKLTWDETDQKRRNVLEKAFDKDNDDDLKAYLASSSSEDEQDDDVDIGADMGDNEKIQKYKNLLKSLDNEKDEDYEMQVTWNPSLKSDTKNLMDKKSSQSVENDPNDVPLDDSASDIDANDKLISDDSEEEIPKSKTDKSKDKFKRWKKKKNVKNSENAINGEDASNLELLMIDIEKGEKGKQHFNYKQIVDEYAKQGGKQKDDNRVDQSKDSFQFNADDPRFSAIYSSHLYNVDQSDPHFRKTEAFDQILSRRKNKANRLIEEKSSGSKFQVTPITNVHSKSWKSLVNKVKDKTSGVQQRKRPIEGKTFSSDGDRFNTKKKFKR